MASGKKISVIIPGDLAEWADFRAYAGRTSLSQYLVGLVRADRDGAGDRQLEEFAAARAMREEADAGAGE